MLRALVLLLLLANAGYFAWSQGLLAAWGLAPAPTGEPHRLQQQIKPEALRILRDGEAKGPPQPQAVAAAGSGCDEAPPAPHAPMLRPCRTATERTAS